MVVVRIMRKEEGTLAYMERERTELGELEEEEEEEYQHIL